MEYKLLEIRDKATFIPILAIKLEPDNVFQKYLLRRAGYSFSPPAILLVQIVGGDGWAKCDWAAWSGRTYPVAHKYIEETFYSLVDGQVIDVEFILGETQQPKKSEREEDHL